MTTSGSGAWGGGAWGAAATKQPLYDEPDETVPSAPPANQFGGSGGAYSNAFTSAPSVSNGAGASSSREAELAKREAALAKKEVELRKLENELMAAGGLKRKNWPRCFPMWHHDIPGEIPEESRRVVREVYLCWWGLLFCLSWQVFCASVMLGMNVGDKVPSWFLSIIYWITGVPLSIYLWYRRLYNAARDSGTVGYLWYFLFFMCNIAFCIWCAIAIPFSTARWSFCGFGAAMDAFNVNKFAGTIYIVGASFWTVESVWCLWCLKDSWLFFRSRGSTKAATKQAAQDAAVAAFASNMAGGASNRV